MWNSVASAPNERRFRSFAIIVALSCVVVLVCGINYIWYEEREFCQLNLFARQIDDFLNSLHGVPLLAKIGFSGILGFCTGALIIGGIWLATLGWNQQHRLLGATLVVVGLLVWSIAFTRISWLAECDPDNQAFSSRTV